MDNPFVRDALQRRGRFNSVDANEDDFFGEVFHYGGGHAPEQLIGQTCPVCPVCPICVEASQTPQQPVVAQCNEAVLQKNRDCNAAADALRIEYMDRLSAMGCSMSAATPAPSPAPTPTPAAVQTIVSTSPTDVTTCCNKT